MTLEERNYMLTLTSQLARYPMSMVGTCLADRLDDLRERLSVELEAELV